MSKFNKLIKDQLSPAEEDKLLDEMLSAKFDAELRAKWGAQLKKGHGSKAEKQKRRDKFVRLSIAWRVVAAAASMAAIWFAVYWISQPGTSAQSFAQNQLEATEILHPGTTKGQNSTETKRALAITAFNQQNYEAAIREFDNIADPTLEDRFYHGLALLLDQKEEAAGNILGILRQEASPYQEEAQWYFALSLVLQEKMEAAKTQLSAIEAQDWKFDQAQELLNLIP